MREYIKKLRSKPEHIRKQILTASLIACMSIVLLVWISGLGYQFTKSRAEDKETTKPFALLGQTISETYSNITASVGNVKSIKKEEEKKVEVEKQINLIPVEHQ